VKEDLTSLTTEQINEDTKYIDQLSTMEIIKLINKEDRTVADSIAEELPHIQEAIEVIYEKLKNGGRLFYIGAGTSGRLGVLDAAECPPTFSVSPDLVQALIAGGERAIFFAVEGAEDNRLLGKEDLRNRQVNQSDVVVGIAASGRTPYVIGALEYARSIGAATISISCNRNSQISKYADTKIEVVVGPEVLSGSTRMKAGTAQKMVLNMMTTTTMIKLGKVYGNLMVDLNASNEKLIERAINIVITITGVTHDEASQVLKATSYSVKAAIVMIETGASIEKVELALQATDGFVRRAINLLKKGH
jgi:N-acetylmuramic acid 6-phosphate etherase